MGLATILIVFVVAALIQGSVTDQLFGFSAEENNIQTGRIIGGQEAVKGQFPHQVHLDMVKTNSTWFCGGSLIHPQWVLSAGHCVQGGIEWIDVLLGEINATKPGVRRNTSTFYVHPNFDPIVYNNDLVMIDLLQPVELSDTIRPIRLPAADASDYAGEKCTISGWGRTEPNGTNPIILRYVHMKVITNSECTNYWPNDWIINSTVCARGFDNDNQNACYGDSGGPLAYYEDNVPTLVGVFSFVKDFCLIGKPTGYIRPQYYLEWINSYMGA